MDKIDECGMGEDMAPGMPAMDQGQPVTMNVNMTASGKDHVADLIDMMKNAGLGDAEEVSAKTLSPRMDMERLRGLVDEPGDEDTDEAYSPGDENAEGMVSNCCSAPVQDERNGTGRCSACGEGCEAVAEEAVEEWANSPEGSEGDEDYRDADYMTRDLAGGINREKKQFKAAQPGDNAMAAEAIKAELYAALSEKKGKPDFLDLDKDGDKKEPMKKAAKDAGDSKGSKPKKGEVPPQFKKK